MVYRTLVDRVIVDRVNLQFIVYTNHPRRRLIMRAVSEQLPRYVAHHH